MTFIKMTSGEGSNFSSGHTLSGALAGGCRDTPMIPPHRKSSGTG